MTKPRLLSHSAILLLAAIGVAAAVISYAQTKALNGGHVALADTSARACVPSAETPDGYYLSCAGFLE